MKKFMKGCGIAALACLVIGLVLALVAGAIQGPMTISEIVSNVTNGKVQMNLYDWDDWGIRLNDATEKLEQGMTVVEDELEYATPGVEADSIVFDRDQTILTGNVSSQNMGSDITRMDIELGGCEVELVASEDECIYVSAEETGRFQCFVRNHTLYLRAVKTYNWSESTKKCRVLVEIPANVRFGDVDIELGAGGLSGDTLLADQIALEVGAGSIVMDYLEAQEMKLTIGAGSIDVGEMKTDVLDIEVGAGRLEAAGEVRQSADIECAMGHVGLRLNGVSEDYNYQIECAMGSVNIDGATIQGIAQEQKIDNHSARNIDVECGMGSVDILF